MRTQSSFRLLGVFAIIQKETSSLTHVICQKYLHYWLYFYIHVRASTSDGNCKKSLKDFSWNFNCRVEISLVRPVTHLLVPWLRFSVVSWQQSEVQWRRCDCHVGQELRCVLFPRVEVCMNAEASFRWGAHSGCHSQHTLCHFDLCSCDIFRSCQTKVLSLCSKAQVTWFMLPVWTYSSQTPESYLVVLTELDLKMQRKNSIFVLILEL